MEKLFLSQERILAAVKSDFKRNMLTTLPWGERAIMLFGARGSGKTTLLLQHLKFNLKGKNALYITMDDMYFSLNTLFDTALAFHQQAGKVLIIDEIHKYPDWSREVKNIYDLIPNLKLIITGSSILELQKSDADLSRRVLNFQLPELSFREFLCLRKKTELPIFELNDILQNHIDLARSLNEKEENLLFQFKSFMSMGAYPFFTETDFVHTRLNQTINLIIDVDLPNTINVEFRTLNQLKKLLYLIAQSVPFTPNVTKLAEQVGCTRTKLYEMLQILEVARLIYGLHSSGGPSSALSKPEKLYLHNGTLLTALSNERPNIGTLRETTFMNQLESKGHAINFTKTGDFLVDEHHLFEIGGAAKTRKQLKDKPGAFVVQDDIEVGFNKTIPLWLFGLLY